MADEFHRDVTRDVKFAIVYEHNLADDIHSYNVRAFPTYVMMIGGSEHGRVEGANMGAVRNLVETSPTQSLGEGHTIGGSDVKPLSPEEARAARLAALEATNALSAGEKATTDSAPEKTTTVAEAEKNAEAAGDVEMQDAEEERVPGETKDPTTDLDPAAITALTESMGFPLIRAQKGLIHGNGGNVEGAIEWLLQHQDDDDIDDPIPAEPVQKAQAYKCNECGKILSNMANLELHANKTGHADFEESTDQVKPLTAEEKAAKLSEIKELVKAKRQEREEKEKSEDVDREKQRRFMGKEMAKTKEEMEIIQRKRDVELRRKEKEAFQRERLRLRDELARDKAERMSNKGKLGSKLGVEGYKPDGVQYDVDADMEDVPALKKPKPQASAAKIDEYITKVSSYRAGGDGEKCLKVLLAYVGNVADSPDEEKFKTINMENKSFKTKVKPFFGAKQLLMAVGFNPNEAGDALTLRGDADYQLLLDVKIKLKAALDAY
jgi:hypothetical protein